MLFNDKNEIIEEEYQRAILVGVQLDEDISYSMEELKQLAEASGAEVVGEMTQNKERIDTAFHIGKGKVEELKAACQSLEANIVIFNNELSGMQLRNIEDKLDIKVIDRTILILDIFAKRAVSKEGKLQVELAQLQYRMPRLTGFGKSLSRTGGGIGTRGPGEMKLETDRRHIQRRMDEIKRELNEVKMNRMVQRAKRNKSELPVVALVGYTNSGKSTIMNEMLKICNKEEKNVYVEDMLFATLDTSQRNIKLDTNEEFILIDTVGFVSKLPHSLIRAFKATLEEVLYADLLIHVIDASYPDHDFHIEVTDKVLQEIGAENKNKLYVYNKMDLMDHDGDLLPSGDNILYISAKKGTNMDQFVQTIRNLLFSDSVRTKLLIPYDRGDISSYLCEKCKIISMDYTEAGTSFEAELQKSDYNRFEKYQVD